MASDPKPLICGLPAEIREAIYSIILHPANNRRSLPNEHVEYSFHDALQLLRVNRQIYYEARKVFRQLNVFVRIETPWIEAQEHVKLEGHVAIVLKDQRAELFPHHSLRVAIGPPHLPPDFDDMPEPQCFIILGDDLPAFTKTWFYSNLSNPGLNRFLKLDLQLRDPLAADGDEKHVPPQIQRSLLLPFGMVKELGELSITGDPEPNPAIVSQLRSEQAIPIPGPEEALAECAGFKAQGNEALKAGDYKGALSYYNKAWEAMHVIIRGRERHVHAEAFFSRELTSGPFEGKNGQLERLNLRIQLVANTCLAYLKLEDWVELEYWGMRTIRLLRHATGANEADIAPADEALLLVPNSPLIGKIYYRTAIAYKNLGDRSQARKLLLVAHIYLPQDRIVANEVASCAPALGI